NKLKVNIKTFLINLLIYFYSLLSHTLSTRTMDSPQSTQSTFLYFAYGSNLLKERLQLKNPSATVHCVAKLKDYRLVFGNHQGRASERWHGVWGVVWRLSVSDLESLDSQENVTLGAYCPVELSVTTTGEDLCCRTYIMNSCVYAPPSPQYLKVIVMGAEQNGLPPEYQAKLRSIKTNEYEGPLPVMAELERARRAHSATPPR
uniref:Gamma-glutamylcyclotransferase b n=1 Tax=Neogobius melanostomus TaxID=47308 RepID=A0A8C6SMR4_9GOBI